MKRAPTEALAARRAALRAELARRLEAARAATSARRAVKTKRSPREEERRRRRWLLLLLALLLLLLCMRCGCVPPPPPGVALDGPAAPAPSATALPPDPPPARIPPRHRPRFKVTAPAPLPWLDAFRLQVAARSPRLAECFTGVARPGALKWTASVEPAHGLVSDQLLEPTLSGDDLDSVQRACVFGVLASPPYALTPGDSPSTPARVGIVIEF